MLHLERATVPIPRILLMRPFILSFLALASGTFSLAAPETIPTSPEEQMRIFEEMAAKETFACYDTDEEGNIVFVGFNHAYHGRNPFARSQERRNDKDTVPGLSDEDFGKILRFPELRGIAAQNLKLTDEGYAVLQAFPELEVLNLSNLKTGWPDDYSGPTPGSRTLRYVDGACGLKIWDTTHSFGFNKEPPVLNEMQGFPELKVLIVDVGHANDFDELFPFIRKSPNIEFLKLHRCTFSEDQMRRILDALPKLKRLDMKPNGNTPGERWSYQSLALLKDHPNIQYVRLIHGDSLPLPWENGLEHLVDAEGLTHIEFPLEDRGRAVDPADLRKLMDARPNLNILRLPEELLPADVNARSRSRNLRNQMDEAVNPISHRWAVGPQ